jgi:triphosphatase
MAKPDREIELKVELTSKGWERLLANPALQTFSNGPAHSEELVSIYFDTPDHVLERNAVVLRVRRSGEGWRQTIKAEIGVRGGISNPLEAEIEVADGQPDLSLGKGPLSETLRNLVGEQPLCCIFETIVHRTTHMLALGEGRVVELALDEGHIRAGNAKMALREAEFELKEGDANILRVVAEALLTGTTFRLGSLSKAERGYRLLRGESAPPIRPEKSVLERVTEAHSCADAFARACGSASQQILANWQAVIDTADPEGPHQLRIGLRRLRTALRIFRPSIASEALHDLQSDARLLARRVGELRDLDVMAEEIVGPIARRNPEMDGLQALQDLLDKRRAQTRKRLQRELTQDRWLPLRLRIALLPHGAGWTGCVATDDALRPVVSQARGALDIAWKRVKRRARHLHTLSIEDRHELRKKLKALRYAAEYLAPLFPDADVDRFTRHLRQLLDIFGYLNDVAMAEALTGLCRAEKIAAAERAAAYVLGWHSAIAEQAWENVPKRWRKLRHAGRFWR